MQPGSFPVRRNVLLFYTFGFLMDSGLWVGIWIKYLLDGRGFELKWILLMDLPFWLLVALLQAPMGALADHIGRRRVLCAAGIVYALTILGFGFTTSYWMLFFDYVIWALAMSLSSGADHALVYDSMRAAGSEAGYQRVASRAYAVRLAAATAAVVGGGVVAHYTSLAFTVQISTLFPLAAAVAALAMREAPVARKETRYWASLRAGLAFARDVARVRYTLALGSVLLVATFGPVVLVQPFLIHHQVETFYFGVFQAPLRIATVVAALASVAVVARLGFGRLLLAASIATVGTHLALAAFDVTPAFAFFLLPAVVSGLTNPAVNNHLNRLIPSDLRATVLSVEQLAFALQVAFFEPALGLFADLVSLQAAFLFTAAYFLLTLPPLLVLWRRAHRGEPLPSSVPAALEPVAPA